jgi:histidine phosphotransferase ChpT
MTAAPESPPDEALALAQALCTRLSHDLAGPLGAIGSGTELLAEEGGGGDAEVIRLLADSAATAATRLRVLRALLGRPTGHGLEPAQARALLSEHLGTAGGGPVPTLDWDVAPGDGSTRIRAEIQLVLNLCLVALDALSRPDHIGVRMPEAGRAEITLKGRGDPRPGALEALSDGLKGGTAPEDPRHAQAVYAGRLARHLRRDVAVDHAPGHLRLSVRPR